VGKGNYTVVFFGDHGGTNVTNNGQWIVNEDVNEALEAEFGAGIVKRQGNDQFWLDQEVLRGSGRPNEDVARWMERQFKWLIRAYTKRAVEAAGQCHLNLDGT